MYEDCFRYTGCLASDAKDLREHMQSLTLLRATSLEYLKIRTHVVKRRLIIWLEEPSEVVVETAKI